MLRFGGGGGGVSDHYFKVGQSTGNTSVLARVGLKPLADLIGYSA